MGKGLGLEPIARPFTCTTMVIAWPPGMNEDLGSNLSWWDMERVASTNIAARGRSRDRRLGYFDARQLSLGRGRLGGDNEGYIPSRVRLPYDDGVDGRRRATGSKGFAQWITYDKVYGTSAEQSIVDYAAKAKKDGKLPDLHTLTSSWSTVITSSSENLETAYGVSYLAVKYLTQKAGGMPPLQVLQRTAAGEDFETTLSALTGYNLNTLNGDYRSIIPDI